MSPNEPSIVQGWVKVKDYGRGELTLSVGPEDFGALDIDDHVAVIVLTSREMRKEYIKLAEAAGLLDDRSPDEESR